VAGNYWGTININKSYIIFISDLKTEVTYYFVLILETIVKIILKWLFERFFYKIK
jgi:hypothetical protein